MHTKVHEGRNIKRIREILGIKQEALAVDLGEDWTQKKVSLLEQKEEIDAPLLEQVAKALKVPVDAIKTFDEDAAINIISNNTFENCEQPASVFNNSPINPVDKWIEALAKNEQLYERLLKTEREKVALLEEMLKKK